MPVAVADLADGGRGRTKGAEPLLGGGLGQLGEAGGRGLRALRVEALDPGRPQAGERRVPELGPETALEAPEPVHVVA